MSDETRSSSAVSPMAGLPAPALVRALRRLLRPLVRLLLAKQVTYPFLANLLKAVYVEVAEREFAIAGKSQTTSRLSLLTGIHRKDAERLRLVLWFAQGSAVSGVGTGKVVLELGFIDETR